jgi:benzylsuccinate CoA-transferase BbsF subunit
LGEPSLAFHSSYNTAAARKANEAALDSEIDRLTAGHDAYDLAYRLQEAGIAAGPVAQASDLFADPQYSYRQFWRRLQHPELGDHAVLMHSFKISEMDAGPRRAAPLLGEHTYEVCRDLLRMDDNEFARLTSAQVLH